MIRNLTSLHNRIYVMHFSIINLLSSSLILSFTECHDLLKKKCEPKEKTNNFKDVTYERSVTDIMISLA